MSLKLFSTREKFTQEAARQAAILQEVDKERNYFIHRAVARLIQGETTIQELYGMVFNMHEFTYTKNNLPHTARSLHLMTLLEIVRCGLPYQTIWKTFFDLIEDIVEAFNELTPYSSWDYSIGERKPTIGNNLVGMYRVMEYLRLLPEEILLTDDILDAIWAEKVGDNVIFIEPGEVLLVGGRKRELTLSTMTPLSPLHPQAITWTRFPRTSFQNLPPIKLSTYKKLHAAISNYRGAKLLGEIETPQSEKLCRWAGVSLESVENTLCAVLGTSTRGKGFA